MAKAIINPLYKGESWKFKTGNLYIMRSSSSPAPFTCGSSYLEAYTPGGVSSGTPPQCIFDNNTGTWVWNNSVFTPSAWIRFGRIIRVKQLKIRLSGFTVYARKEDGTQVHIGNSSVIDLDAPIECVGLDVVNTSRPSYAYEVQVTEWYEK